MPLLSRTRVTGRRVGALCTSYPRHRETATRADEAVRTSTIPYYRKALRVVRDEEPRPSAQERSATGR